MIFAKLEVLGRCWVAERRSKLTLGPAGDK
jgi:hypothetical protein